MKYILIILLTALAMTAWKCSNLNVSGGGTDIENGRVTGYIVNQASLTPASHAVVRLARSSMDPVSCGPNCTSFSTITDSAGRYEFGSVPRDSYSLFAVASDGRENILRSGIAVTAATVLLGADSLKIPGKVTITLPVFEAAAGDYVYVPGTPLFWIVRQHRDKVRRAYRG